MLRVIVAMLIALVPASFACAHKPSDSYLTLQIDGAEIRGRWDIALRDLDYAIGLDADQDGALTWGEVRARQGAIAAYALARLALAAGASDCPAHATEHLIDRHSDGAYAVIRFSSQCAPAGRCTQHRLSAVLRPRPATPRVASARARQHGEKRHLLAPARAAAVRGTR